jgi:hypothetical protein
VIAGFGSNIYSHVFNFRFAERISPPERMRLLSELFDLLLSSGYSATDIYWYRTDYTGFVECYSNRPEVTNLIERWLDEKENRKVLQQLRPGFKSNSISNSLQQ